MLFFSGEYECKIDAKGRMVLPAKVKSKMPEANSTEMIVSRGFEPCLVLYPVVEWKKIFARVSGLNEFNEEFRSFQRNFFRGQTESELDGNGRLLLPKTMLKYAGITKEVVVVGMGNRIEVWDPDKYNEYLIQDQGEFSQLAEKYLANNKE